MPAANSYVKSSSSTCYLHGPTLAVEWIALKSSSDFKGATYSYINIILLEHFSIHSVQVIALGLLLLLFISIKK